MYKASGTLPEAAGDETELRKNFETGMTKTTQKKRQTPAGSLTASSPSDNCTTNGECLTYTTAVPVMINENRYKATVMKCFFMMPYV